MSIGPTVSKTNRSVLCLISAAVLATSCHRKNPEDLPVRITPTKPLTAQLGQEIDWSFTAERGSRKLNIIDIAFDNLPLGVMKIHEAKPLILKGKVLTRDIRLGLIRVLAFDEIACNNSYERLKKMATEQVQATGNTNMTLPTSPCKLAGGNDYANAGEFMFQGYFSWTMTDGPDDLSIDQYPKFIADHLFQSTYKSPVDGMIEIPTRESPDSGDVLLGACAAIPRKQCGRDPNCLWGLVSCISKDVTGRSVATSSLAAGSQTGATIIIDGDAKQ
jgi:hypothetical protein